jgi:membrane protease subunit (stomatin/prohibitin family)
MNHRKRYFIALFVCFTTTSSFAQGSVQHSVEASKASVGASAHTVLALSKGAAAVSTVPLALSADLGRASGRAAAHTAQWADIQTPLPVAEETFVTMPPAEALAGEPR